jgi:hypothetical protein
MMQKTRRKMDAALKAKLALEVLWERSTVTGAGQHNRSGVSAGLWAGCKGLVAAGF